jgi:hypothetical protein
MLPDFTEIRSHVTSLMSNSKHIYISKLEGMWENAVVTQIEILRGIFLEQLKKTNRNLKMCSLRGKI